MAGSCKNLFQYYKDYLISFSIYKQPANLDLWLEGKGNGSVILKKGPVYYGRRGEEKKDVIEKGFQT